MPRIETVADSVKAAAAIADGELTPIEAAELSKVVAGYTRAVETADLNAGWCGSNKHKRNRTIMATALETRLRRLEARNDQGALQFIVVGD